MEEHYIMEKTVTTTDVKVREAAQQTPAAAGVLRTLFPEAFPPRDAKVGELAYPVGTSHLSIVVSVSDGSWRGVYINPGTGESFVTHWLGRPVFAGKVLTGFNTKEAQ